MKLNRELVDVLGLKCEYLATSEGGLPPILYLHGWGSRAERYEYFLKNISGNFNKIVIPDLPGFGGSEKPKNVWGVEEYVLWISSFIEKMGWQKIIIAGHSFGGGIAAVYAARNPKLVDGLILYGAAGFSERKKKKLKFYKNIASVGKIVFSIPPLSNIFPVVRKVFYRIIGSTDYLNSGDMKDIFKKVIERDLRHELQNISVPTVVIWGEKDDKTPVSDARLIRENIKNSKLFIYKGRDHMMHNDPVFFTEIFCNAVNELKK